MIGFGPKLPDLFQISPSVAMCNKGIKIINMLIFFTWILPALTAVFYSSMLHLAILHD